MGDAESLAMLRMIGARVSFTSAKMAPRRAISQPGRRYRTTIIKQENSVFSLFSLRKRVVDDEQRTI